MQRRYTQVFQSVNKNQKPLVVMANNNPQAAIISMEMLDEFNRLKARQDLFELIEQIGQRSRKLDEDEVLRDIEQELNPIRQRIYEKTFGGNWY